MSTLFHVPKVAAPKQDTVAVQKAAALEAAKRRQGMGYRSTILTSLMPMTPPGQSTTGGA